MILFNESAADLLVSYVGLCHWMLIGCAAWIGWHIGGDWMETRAWRCVSAASAHQAACSSYWLRNTDPLCCFCGHRWEFLSFGRCIDTRSVIYAEIKVSSVRIINNICFIELQLWMVDIVECTAWMELTEYSKTSNWRALPASIRTSCFCLQLVLETLLLLQ